MTTPDQDTPAGQETPPTCYRHPDRETWVSCVRCGRHACPDCLRSAAVGQQCVDCVHEGSRTTRRPTTVFGGRPARTAVVTWTLIAVNVLLFLIELARPSIANDWELLGYARFSYGGAAAGHRLRPVVPADHVGVPAAGGRGDRRPGLLRHPVQPVGAVGGGAEPGAAARPGPLHHRLPAQRARRRRRCSSSSPRRTSPPWAPAARSTACSAPGSWSPGGCRSTPGGSWC